MRAPLPVNAAGLPSGAEAWLLHDAASTRRIEAAGSRGLPEQALMQRAGLAVARMAMALAPHAPHLHVLCGPGNNGGDGLLAAAHLRRAGKSVQVSLLKHGRIPDDAAAALQVAIDAGVDIATGAETLRTGRAAALVIDALFGIGLKRAPVGHAAAAIEAMHASGAPILAVDVPSGLDADTGVPVDAGAVVRARWTLSLLTLKPGLFTGGGRDHAGDVWFDDLGAQQDGDAAEAPTAMLVTGSASFWPTRLHAHHKGSFGDVWVVGGAAGMRGASWLAARAALSAGAGRVMVVPVDGMSATEFDASHPELMLRQPQALLARETPLEAATVVCGCGAGQGDAWRALLPVLIARAGRLLLDADALNALAADRSLGRGLAARAQRGRPTVLTPHPLEAARLLGCAAAQVQADRLASARRIAQEFGSLVVLKGSGSVIAAPDGSLWINGSGNAALASAGTGDVLAGWIGGLWSQGLPIEDAVRLGVHSHGAAADRWSARVGNGTPLAASVLIEALGERS
jgi:hydroxyethylthiazole kinase-like uncharacterized protein yjeF